MNKKNENSFRLFLESEKPKPAEVTLAIETGIAAGSISLLKNDEEIDFWTGEGTVSKSEDILGAIQNLIFKNNIKIESINLIAFSGGPGSFTGLRIGAAVAKGLARSVSCNIKSEPILEAMMVNAVEGKISASAVPFGKNQVCWQLFKTGSNGFDGFLNAKPFIEQKDFFLVNYHQIEADILILHDHLYQEVAGNHKLMLINAGKNLASFVGLKASGKKWKTYNSANLNYLENR